MRPISRSCQSGGIPAGSSTALARLISAKKPGHPGFLFAPATLANYAAFLHCSRNSLRALPCNFCSSALAEHSFDFAVFATNGLAGFAAAFFSVLAAGASLLASAGAAAAAGAAGAAVTAAALGATTAAGQKSARSKPTNKNCTAKPAKNSAKNAKKRLNSPTLNAQIKSRGAPLFCAYQPSKGCAATCRDAATLA